MNDTNGNEKVIQLMNNAIDEAIGLINKAVLEILKDFREKAIKTLSLAQNKLNMESEDSSIDKEFKIDDRVWCLISGSGYIAGKITGISFNDNYIVSLIAGPNKFNQEVYAKESQLKVRKV